MDQMGAVRSSRRWKVLGQWPGVSPRPGRSVLCQLGHLTLLRRSPHMCCQLPVQERGEQLYKHKENCCHFKTRLGIDARPPAGLMLLSSPLN